MAVGEAQYGREAVEGGSDDWSFTVDELLKVTASKPIVMSASNVLRGVSTVVGLVVDAARKPGDTGGSIPPEDETPEWPDGPISTVHLTFAPIDVPR
jgi:hypothetical protein